MGPRATLTVRRLGEEGVEVVALQGLELTVDRGKPATGLARLPVPDGAIDAELVKELAFLLFSIAEKNGWTGDAQLTAEHVAETARRIPQLTGNRADRHTLDQLRHRRRQLHLPPPLLHRPSCRPSS